MSVVLSHFSVDTWVGFTLVVERLLGLGSFLLNRVYLLLQKIKGTLHPLHNGVSSESYIQLNN